MAPDRTSIVVGNRAAENTIRIYEDARCPFCARFERAAEPLLSRLARGGDVKIEYVLASFLDDRLGGSGSVRAANAMRASVRTGHFPEYHAALYAHQPPEQLDGYQSGFLLRTANTVPGLRDREFDRDVKHLEHLAWVERSEHAYEAVASGTPSMHVNGRAVPVDSQHHMYDRKGIAKVLDSLLHRRH
ncbi:thioredoxin domain-containing protein [Streptomyces sp. NPDC047028]|uniref:DsbA family protein n=1 Tax=Streptomyces sp. NPDC047028 TaxID=3155793 RepID=UPI0033E607CC